MNKYSLPTFKINNLRLVFAFCLAWVTLFSACGVQDGINSTDILSTPTREIEIAQPTNEPKATYTALATKPATGVVTKSLDSLTPIATMTLLPTPTLNAEELRQKWQGIDTKIATVMASNDECQLPCWWGIKLGDLPTNARQVFDDIDNNGWVNSNEQWGDLQQTGFFKHTYRNDIGEDIYVGFSIDLLVQEESIKVINIFVGRSVSFDSVTPEYTQISERLLRDWEQYSVQNIFETFGVPEQVNLLPRNFADGDNLFYEFNLYYLTLGIVASYDFPLLGSDSGERKMCINMFDMNSMDLYLYDPIEGLPESYLQAIYTLWPLAGELKPEESPLIESSDLESRTGMSIEEFVTFISDNEDDCFNVN